MVLEAGSSAYERGGGLLNSIHSNRPPPFILKTGEYYFPPFTDVESEA